MEEQFNARKFGYYVSLATTILAALTFGMAILTPPMSGPFCKGLCIEYPFTDILSRFPRDYIWMYPAIILPLLFVSLIACLHQISAGGKSVFTRIGLSFSIISAAILIVTYFIQVTVIQPSIEKGEFDGISLLNQYNPHGLFIALEEIGYLMMALVFISVVPAFSKFGKTGKAIRWVFIISFILTVVSFIVISIIHGIYREYRFEVAIITINYVTLIISGILIAKMFKKLNIEYKMRPGYNQITKSL